MKAKSGSIVIVILSIVCVVLLIKVFHVHAGCGCEKPPPPPAEIIPNATYPGSYVRIYDIKFKTGESYVVLFDQTETTGVADVDREGRKRIKVLIPETDDVGPTTVRVLDKKSRTIKSISGYQFTLVTKPVTLHAKNGVYRYNNYKAAVDSTGTLILSFELTGITEPLNFIGRFLNEGLRINGSEDVVFYNIQGYLMTDMGSYELPYHIPGLNKVIKSSDDGSDMILYWRHEFETYAAAHEPGQPHERDPLDPDYHLDGTPCIDHDHIILKVAAHDLNGAKLSPGYIDGIQFVIGVYRENSQVFDFLSNPEEIDYDDDYDLMNVN